MESNERKLVTTPWGRAAVVEEACVRQTAGERGFASLVQLLELVDGGEEQLLRVAYTTDGVARRGPVTIRLAELPALREALAGAPQLTAAFTGARCARQKARP